MTALIKKLFCKFRQIISFGLVGCVNTLVDFLTFTLASEALSLTPAVSQAIGYACGTLCSFVLNRRYTFKDGERRLWGQLLLFLAVNLCSVFLSSRLISALTGAGANVYLAKVAVTVIFMAVNFLAYKFIVFRDGKKQKPDAGDEQGGNVQ